MPYIHPVHVQQTLQMSSAVEKVQMQQVLHLAGDQLESEILKKQDLEKATEIQDPEKAEGAEPTDPDQSGNKRQVRIKKTTEKAEKEEERPDSPLPVPEDTLGAKLNITV